MGELEKISIGLEDIPRLVKGIVAKLLPEQLHWSEYHGSAISRVADYVKLKNISYEVDEETRKRFLGHIGELKKEILESAQ